MSVALAKGIRIGLIVLLSMPLIVTENQTIFPHAVGKAIFARSLIELLAAAWVILIVVDPAYRPKRSWVLLAFGGYVVVSLLAAAFGVSFTKSFWSEYGRMMGVWDLFHWFLLVVIASTVLRTSAQWRFFLTWLLVVSLILSVVALGQAYDFSLPFLPPTVDRQVQRVDATLGNPSFLAAILVVTTLLALGFLARSFLKPDPEEGEARAPLIRGRGRRPTRRQEEQRLRDFERQQRMLLQLRRLFWVAVVVVGLWALLLTGTRGAFVGLTAGLIAMPIALTIWGNRRALAHVAVPAGGALLSLVIIFVVAEVADFGFGRSRAGPNIFSRFIDTSPGESSLGSRLQSGKIALEAFASRPILGWGPENYSAAFNRNVDAKFFEVNTKDFDQAHISVVEELATRGILGAILFLAMWTAAFRGVLRRRRPPREEVLAYAVFGALVGYFVQSLALFDTPAMLLVWAVLIAWVASQDQVREAAPEQRAPRSRRSGPAPRARDLAGSAERALRTPLGLTSLGIVVTAILVLSLTLMNQRPYASAELALDAIRPGQSWTTRLSFYQDGFDTFPGLANRPRQAFFEAVEPEWDNLSPTEQAQALQIANTELERGLGAEPSNAILLHSAIVLFQEAATTHEDLERIEPLLEKLRELAPERLQTHKRLAFQELVKGNPQGALDVIQRYFEKAPKTGPLFNDIQVPAIADLQAQQAG